MPEIPIIDLTIPSDDTVIPRVRIDTFLQSEYRQAFLAYGGWGDFPPITVDQNYLVLDGVTRVLAAESADIDKAKAKLINCDDAERLLIVAQSNATHGKRWEPRDIVILTNLAERFKVDPKDLAGALRVPISRIERIPVATVQKETVGGGNERERIYVKRSVRSALAGRVITERQAAMMDALSTPNAANLVLEDFLRLAELGALPPLDPGILEVIENVREQLDLWVARDDHLLTATA